MTFLRTIHICEEEQFVEPGIMLGKGEYYRIPIRLYFLHAECHIETWAVLMPPLLVGFWDWWTLSNLCMVSAVTWQNWDRNSDVLYPKPFRPLLLLFSHSVLYDSLQSHGLQGARLPCPSPTPGDCSSSYPLSRWCHPTISSSVVPFSSCLQSFPASGSFPMSRLFASGGQNIRALVSASVLSVFRIDFLQDWLVWSPCSPRDSQESSPTPQFKSINSSALNLLYRPSLTSVHDYWKNHSSDYMDLCQQSSISDF